MMKKFPMLLAAAAVSLAACSASGQPTERVKASGQQGQRSFPLANFDRVALEGPDDVEVRVGPAFSVTAQGDTGIMQALDVRVEGNTLKLARKRQDGFNWGGRVEDGDSKIRFTVTLPTIRAASLVGAGDMKVDRVSGGDFNADLAGAGDLSLGEVAVAALDIDLAGAGDVDVAGTAERLSVQIAGAGDIDAPRLTARAAKISTAGAGNVRAVVNGPAEVSIVGAGDVDLGPGARCKTSKMGAGEVRCGG